MCSNEDISNLAKDIDNLYAYNAVDNTVKEKVERMKKKMEKKMSFTKFECKDVGIPTGHSISLQQKFRNDPLRF